MNKCSKSLIKRRKEKAQRKRKHRKRHSLGVLHQGPIEGCGSLCSSPRTVGQSIRSTAMTVPQASAAPGTACLPGRSVSEICVSAHPELPGQPASMPRTALGKLCLRMPGQGGFCTPTPAVAGTLAPFRMLSHFDGGSGSLALSQPSCGAPWCSSGPPESWNWCALVTSALCKCV